MPFDPAGFFELAQELAAPGASEARLRTAVARTYYAVFLVAREKLGVTTQDDVHSTVIGQVKARYRVAGDQLDKLRRLRRRADYELDPTSPNWQADWTTTLEVATHLLPNIRTMR